MNPTNSGPASDASPETTETIGAGGSISNEAFLAAVFGALPPDERPIVVQVKGALGAKTKWPMGDGWCAGHGLVDDVAANNYFSLATFRPVDGCYRRRKALFVRAFGLMLDDIGTKAAPFDRLQACPPSYVIETSTGNLQVGYLFAEPVTDLRQLDALSKALAAVGLSDPGATGPATRLGRLPVGMNGKYDPPARCRLLEWKPDRRYAPEDILGRLDVAPVPEPSVRKTGRGKAGANAPPDHLDGDVHVPRTPDNPVVVALRARNLYKAPLGGGRHDITCPWVGEHTDAIDHGTAYFEPSDLFPIGGFKCQHSHGEHKRIRALLEFLGVTPNQAKHRPTIRVVPGELHRVADAAERELAASGYYYQRGGLIVSVHTDPSTGETRIESTTLNALTRTLAASAIWERFDGRSGNFVPIDPPARHMGVLHESQVFNHLPALRGLARQPYLRADGTLMLRSGFDAASAMFGAFREGDFKVPERPSRQQAEAALAQLLVLLNEFSFAQAHDCSAALAAMLTAAIRSSLPVAPMFHMRAPQRGSGKSFLSELVAMFAGPARPPALAFPSTDEECDKLLLSALLPAPAVLMFDNLVTDLRPFKALCSALTEPSLSGRLLGHSRTATVPTATLILSSGNNVGPIQDMCRRCITINLDPRCENPATRAFAADPVAMVRERRAYYVSQALMVVRAYIVAGEPNQGLTPIAGYGDWARRVRAALVWLGLADPATALFATMEDDPDRQVLGRLLLAWRAAFGLAPAGVRDVVRHTNDFALRDSDLAELVREIADERGEINRRRLGRWLAHHEACVVHGLRLERDRSRAGGAERWRVRVMDMAEGIQTVGCKGTSGEMRVTGVLGRGQKEAPQTVTDPDMQELVL